MIDFIKLTAKKISAEYENYNVHYIYERRKDLHYYSSLYIINDGVCYTCTSNQWYTYNDDSRIGKVDGMTEEELNDFMFVECI